MKPYLPKHAEWIAKPTSALLRIELAIKLFGAISYIVLAFTFPILILFVVAGSFLLLLLTRHINKVNIVTAYQSRAENEFVIFTTVKFRLDDFPYAQDRGFLILTPEHYLFEGEHTVLSGPLYQARVKQEINCIELDFPETKLNVRFNNWRFFRLFQGKDLRMLLKNVSMKIPQDQIELAPPLVKTHTILIHAINKIIIGSISMTSIGIFAPTILKSELPLGSEAIWIIQSMVIIAFLLKATVATIDFLKFYSLLNKGLKDPSALISYELEDAPTRVLNL